MRTKKKSLKPLKLVRVKKATRKPAVAVAAPEAITPTPEPIVINHARLALQEEAMNKKVA